MAIPKKNAVWITAITTLSVVSVAIAYYAWHRNHDARRVAALQEQLLAGTELSVADRNQLKLQLMRTIDEMAPDKRRELQRDMFRQQRERMVAVADEYRLAIDAQKVAILDRELNEWQHSREVASLFGGGGGGGGGRGGRGGRGGGGRGGRGGRQAGTGGPGNGPAQARPAAPGNGNPPATAGANGNRGPQAGRGPRDFGGRGGFDMTDEQRAAMGEFMQALQQRAEEQGVELGRRGNGGRRNNGGPPAPGSASPGRPAQSPSSQTAKPK